MKDYLLSIGNSSDGQIGLCAYVKAENKTDALDQFRKELGEMVQLKGGQYYQNVYLNWDKITKNDIELA